MNKKVLKISVEELAEIGAHLGHQTRRWNPKIRDYIYGEREGVHVFDLFKTKDMLKDALLFVAKSISDGKTLLLVCTKNQLSDKVRQVSEKCGIYYVNERWLGGTLTNFGHIKRSLAKLEDLELKLQSGGFKGYTKKEKLLLQREVDRLNRFFGGLRGLNRLPDILFVVDIRREKTAVYEAQRKGVSVVAVVDSNSDPTLVDYPIPMNDDSVSAVSYILDLLSEVILLSRSGKKFEIE